MEKNKTHLVFMGAPGSGKGTQSKLFVSEMGYHHISTGDLLRSEVKEKTELGQRVAGLMERGELVDDSTVFAILRANCDLGRHAYIFDGFPRTKDQLKTFMEFLEDHKCLFFLFDVNTDELVERLTNRRVCGNCGEIYNLRSKGPKVDDVCDVCKNVGLLHRKDDTEEVVRDRMKVFGEEMAPVLSELRANGKLLTVDARKGLQEIFDEIKAKL